MIVRGPCRVKTNQVNCQPDGPRPSFNWTTPRPRTSPLPSPLFGSTCSRHPNPPASPRRATPLKSARPVVCTLVCFPSAPRPGEGMAERELWSAILVFDCGWRPAGVSEPLGRWPNGRPNSLGRWTAFHGLTTTPGCCLHVEQTPPAHAGLGAGTSLGLAVALALQQVHGGGTATPPNWRPVSGGFAIGRGHLRLCAGRLHCRTGEDRRRSAVAAGLPFAGARGLANRVVAAGSTSRASAAKNKPRSRRCRLRHLM